MAGPDVYRTPKADAAAHNRGKMQKDPLTPPDALRNIRDMTEFLLARPDVGKPAVAGCVRSGVCFFGRLWRRIPITERVAGRAPAGTRQEEKSIMKRITAWMTALAFVGLTAGQAFAQCAQCAPSNPCKPVCKPVCKPKFKWVKVKEEVEVEVPVKRWVDKMVEVTVKEKQMVEKEVDVTVNTYVDEQVPCTVKKTICVPETYTAYKKECKTIECVGSKRVKKKVPVMVEKTVCKTVKSCDPCTGKTIRTKVEEKVMVEKCKVEYEDVPYTYTKKVWEKVPYEATRMVKQVVDEPSTRTVKKCVPTTVKKKVMECVYVDAKKMVNQPECVVDMVKEKRCVTKRVKVAVEPCAPKACKTGC